MSSGNSNFDNSQNSNNSQMATTCTCRYKNFQPYGDQYERVEEGLEEGRPVHVLSQQAIKECLCREERHSVGGGSMVTSRTKAKSTHCSRQRCLSPLPVSQGRAEQTRKSTSDDRVELAQQLLVISCINSAEYEHDLGLF